MKETFDLSNISATIEKLNINKDDTYVLSIEIGDLPAQPTRVAISRIRELFNARGYNNIIFIPTRHGDFTINFQEANKFLEEIMKKDETI